MSGYRPPSKKTTHTLSFSFKCNGSIWLSMYYCVASACQTLIRGFRLCGWHVTICQRLTKPTSGLCIIRSNLLWSLLYKCQTLCFSIHQQSIALISLLCSAFARVKLQSYHYYTTVTWRICRFELVALLHILLRVEAFQTYSRNKINPN